jgi:hypothetical protein
VLETECAAASLETNLRLCRGGQHLTFGGLRQVARKRRIVCGDFSRGRCNDTLLECDCPTSYAWESLALSRPSTRHSLEQEDSQCSTTELCST